jgi:hypothetical protein
MVLYSEGRIRYVRERRMGNSLLRRIALHQAPGFTAADAGPQCTLRRAANPAFAACIRLACQNFRALRDESAKLHCARSVNGRICRRG